MTTEMKIEKFEFEKTLEATLPPLHMVIEALKPGVPTPHKNNTLTHLQKFFVGLLAKNNNNELQKYASAEGLLKDVRNVVEVRKSLSEQQIKSKEDAMELAKTNPALFKELLSKTASPFYVAGFKAYMYWLGNAGFFTLNKKVQKDGIESLTPTNQNKYNDMARIMNYTPEFMGYVETDHAALSYAKVVRYVLNAEKKNLYVIAKDFFDDFKTVNLKGLTFDHIPPDFCGAIKFPCYLTDSSKEDCLMEVVFSTAEEYGVPLDDLEKTLTGDLTSDDITPDRQRRITFAWWDYGPKGTAIAYFRLCETKKGQTLEEAWNNSCKEGNENPERRGMFDNPLSEGFGQVRKVLINTLVYISSGKPDIRSFTNYIRRNSVTKEPRPAYVTLTDKEVHLVGYNWKKLPNYSTDQWYSKPHAGLRWCGKGRSDLRLVWVQGAFKSRKIGVGTEEPGPRQEEEICEVSSEGI